ncbi:MAG: hypothetical protein GY760_07635 [Deltaproteobacteria bacterium]|nr:hypothetical protein [Deltaproteobacteria bacterium]
MRTKNVILTGIVLLFQSLYAGDLQDKIYDATGFEINGFIDVRQGFRTVDADNQKDYSISELRTRLDTFGEFDLLTLSLKGDFVGDSVDEEGRAELREFSLQFSPFDALDIKLGRYTITWGTGDLVFINDLFPKDWESFFTGRDDEYLKIPSNAVKTSFFSDFVNVDIIWSPIHNESVYIDGSRLSYWNPNTQQIEGINNIMEDEERDNYFHDSEYDLRVSKTFGGTEIALYNHSGYWKTPEGFNASGNLIYPRLVAYGASLRAQILGGIFNIEAGYYDSRDDDKGDDAYIRNSETRFFTGFEKELGKHFTGAFQYYIEWMDDYEEYGSTAVGAKKDEVRHLLTLRLTKLLMTQTLVLSVFTYYSPSDSDFYTRPKVTYKYNDDLLFELGANVFGGSNEHTFFGQFEKNSNVYTAVRLNF